jgi:hypothetical protein
MAKRRLALITNGTLADSNRPASHWKRVYFITRQLLPYDGDDEGTALVTPTPEGLEAFRQTPPRPSRQISN